jgi:PAS domain S-box-containing protein
MIEKISSLSIRTLLIVLLLLLALPSTLLIIDSGLEGRKEAIEHAKRDCSRVVASIAAEQQTLVAGAQQLAITLSLLPDVRSRSQQAVTSILSELVKKNPLYSNIVMSDKAGLVWAQALPFKGQLSIVDRKHYQDVVRTGHFSAGEFAIGRATQKGIMTFGFPVKSASNELIGVIGMAIDLRHAQDVFDKVSLPPGASFGILDHRGIILVRNLKDTFSEKLIGRPDLREENFTKVLKGPNEGIFESMGNDDKPRLVAYKRMSLPDESKPYLYIRSSIPLESVISNANAAMLKNLTLLVLLFGVGLFLAWFIGKHAILKPVMLLKKASEQLGAGAEAVHVSRVVKGGELGELARALDTTAEELVQRGTALRKSEERLRRFYESGLLGVIYWNMDGVIVDANDKFLQMVGYEREDLEAGRIDWVKMTPPEQRHLDDLSTIELKTTGVNKEPFEKEYIRKDGTRMPVLIAGAMLDEARFNGVAFVLDMTERKRAEAEMQNTLQRLYSILSHMQGGILLVGRKGHIEFANQAFCDYFGLKDSPAELTGMAAPQVIEKIKDSYHHSDHEQAHIAEIVGRGQAVIGEEVMMRGGRVFLRDFVPIRIDDKSYGRLWHHVDITNLKKSEETLKERTAQLVAANRELESFCYMVSHDLRTPLRAIDGYVRMLLKEYGDKFDEESARKFNVIRSSARMMGQLIEDLLAFSRLGRHHLSMTKLDIDSLVRETWKELQAANPGRELLLTVRDLASAHGDLSLIRQVCTNLLANAVKFTRGRDVSRIETGSYAEGDKVVYYIRDNGIGFDMAYYHKLFGVFQRLHSGEDFEGTGVGLAIVQRIIHYHEGRVWAEAETDKGATFYFTLPSGELKVSVM